MTPPDLLQTAGTALYGPRWQSELARDLGVASRTVRRWAAGEYDVPGTVWGEIRDLLSARQAEIDQVLAALSADTRSCQPQP